MGVVAGLRIGRLHLGWEWAAAAALVLALVSDVTLAVAPWVNAFVLGFLSSILGLVVGAAVVASRLVRPVEQQPQQPQPDPQQQQPQPDPQQQQPQPDPPSYAKHGGALGLLSFEPEDGEGVEQGSAGWVNVVVSHALSSLDLPALCDRAMLAALANADFIADAKVLACDLSPRRQPSLVHSVRVWTATLPPAPAKPRTTVLRGEVGVDVSLEGRLHLQGDLVVNQPLPNLCALPARILLANVRVCGALVFGVDAAGGAAEVGFRQRPVVDFDLVVELGVGFSLRDAAKLKQVVRFVLVDLVVKSIVQPNTQTVHFPPLL